MSALVDYRREIETFLRDNLPSGPTGIRFIGTHFGEFGPNELDRYAVSAPAIILAPLGVKTSVRYGGMTTFDLEYGAFIITKGQLTDNRGDIALAIVEEVTKLLVNTGTDCGQAPESLSADNLYTSPLDEETGLSLWLVSWSTVIQSETDDSSNLDDFLRLNATYNLDDPDDPDDFDAEQQIEPPQ